MALSTGRVRFRTRTCSSTASRARVRDGGLRLTTVTGGPSTKGTQILSSTCPRGPVDLVSLCCVCMSENWSRSPQLSVMSVAVVQAASATHTRVGEQGVQARHGQFRMMYSCAIVPATPTSVEPCRIPATTRSWWDSLYRTARVGQETLAQSGGVQESVDMFTDTFLPIADIPVDSTTRSGSNVSSRVGKDQLSIHLTRLLGDLKSSKNYCPRKLFSGSNSSPEKSSPENIARFLSRKSVLRPA